MTLPSDPRQTNQRFFARSAASHTVSLFPIAGMLSYFGLIDQPSAVEWLCLMGLSGAAHSVSVLRERHIKASVADGPLRALQDLPRTCGRVRFMAMLSLIIVVPVTMTILGFEGWLERLSILNWSLAVIAGAAASAALEFYASRNQVRDLATEVRFDASTPALVGHRRHSAPLSQSLQIGLFVPAAVALILMLHLVATERHETAEDVALEWSRASLAAVQEGDPSVPLRERVERQKRAQNGWPIAIEIVAISASRVGSEELLAISEAMMTRLDEAMSRNSEHGTLRLGGIDEIGAYSRVDGDVALLAYVSRSGLPSLRGSGAIYSEVVLLIGLLCALVGIGYVMRRDLARAFDVARTSATAMADGDLETTSALESLDEMGSLGDALRRVRSRLRSTRDKVASVLDHVEQNANEAMQAVASMSEGGVEQSRRLGRAHELLISIDAQAHEVSASAASLNDSVEDSSASVAELGAAGAELNQTASVLSEKADDVSGSMEQMVRSVKRVGATTEKLASASEDTSSSMEEMASAMRVVDTSAESMAILSRNVVEKAELGQAKVCQTIEGMDAIREATDAAENVIRGLGARTTAIGGILDVIDDVADETNLLALNAAIIAAQAGEQGRAFSVVADEIKELADRVLASTKEIGGLIRSVQEESENAIGAIEAGTQSVMSGVDLSAEAGRTLEEITEASRENGLRIGEIVSSVREQTKAAGHVVELMERVRDSAEEIAVASTEQDRGNEIIYRSALTMREVAQQVRHTTEEQAEGFGRMSGSVEGVRSIVGRIGQSLQEQTGACGEASQCLEQVVDMNRVNEDVARKLAGAMKALLEQTHALRADLVRD